MRFAQLICSFTTVMSKLTGLPACCLRIAMKMALLIKLVGFLPPYPGLRELSRFFL